MLKATVLCAAVIVTGAWIARAWAEEGPVKAQVYSFKMPPQPLTGLKGVHPRLYLTAERVAKLKKLVAEDKEYGRMFAEVKAIADGAVKSGPKEYVVDDGWSGTEQLWQREVGEVMPEIALTYLITGDKTYLESGKAWMKKSLSYETWGLEPYTGIDLAAGHQLYGIALAYDWLYNDLDDATRKEIREGLVKRARVDYEAAATKKAYWADEFLQNHLWVNITGIAAAGFAVYGETDGVDGFILLPLEKYRRTFQLLSDDGASFEGVPYWGYGIEYILKFADLSRDLLGEEFLKKSEWFEATANFRLYSSLPRNIWTKKADLMSFGDSPRFDWYGPDYLLRKLAGEYKDGHAQWLANEVDAAGVNHPVAQFLNLLWYDASVAPEGPADLPAFKEFKDLGIVFMRTDWSGDETLAAFKCGPHVGYKALGMLSEDPGSGHVHPDEGAFQILAYGEGLIAGCGYTKKMTEYENTLTVDGIGQEGEGYAWFRGDVLCKEKRAARVLATKSTGEMDCIIADLTQAYSAEAGVKRYVRAFCFLKPSIWVVVDRIEAAKPSEFEIYFHSDYPFEDAYGGLYEAKGAKEAIGLVTVAPMDAVTTLLRQQPANADGKKVLPPLETLKVTNKEKTTKETFVNVLYAHPAASEVRAGRMSMLDDGEGGTVVTVSMREGRSWRVRLDLESTCPAAPVLVK